MSSQDGQANPSVGAGHLGDLQLDLNPPDFDDIAVDPQLVLQPGPQLDPQIEEQLVIPPQPLMASPVPSASQSQGPWPRLPPPPPEIAAFLNPQQTPVNHGQVQDKRGNKDTTVANDFYYSVGQLSELLLPQSKKKVTYCGAEFESEVKFTAEEFREYLDCASRRPDGTRWPVLRIQIQPTQYNHRYARGGESHKCRFRDCADERGTILKGQTRVCIQEFDDAHGDWLNPFHNAGYVHLYCLEQQLNLIELYHNPDIRILVEDRRFKHEPTGAANPRLNNPMCLSEVEKGVVWRWLQWTGHRWNAFRAQHPDPQKRPRFELRREDQLFHRLTKAHVQTSTRQQKCATRNVDAADRPTAQLADFAGDLTRHAAMREHMLAQQRQNRADRPTGAKRASSSSSAQEPPQKRRRRMRQEPSERPLLEYMPAFTRPTNLQAQRPKAQAQAQAFRTPVGFPPHPYTPAFARPANLQNQLPNAQSFHTPVSLLPQSRTDGFPQTRAILPEAPATLPQSTPAQPSVMGPRQQGTPPPPAGDCIGDSASSKNTESHATPVPVDGGAEEKRQSISSAALEEAMLEFFSAQDEPQPDPGAGPEAAAGPKVGAEAGAGASDCVMEEV